MTNYIEYMYLKINRNTSNNDVFKSYFKNAVSNSNLDFL